DLLGGFEIDEELKLCRLLDGNVGGFGAFQNTVDKVRGAPPFVRLGRPRAHQAAGLNKLTVMVHRRQPVLRREVQHLTLLSSDNSTWGINERLGAVPFRSRECTVKIVKASHLKR